MANKSRAGVVNLKYCFGFLCVSIFEKIDAGGPLFANMLYSSGQTDYKRELGVKTVADFTPTFWNDRYILQMNLIKDVEAYEVPFILKGKGLDILKYFSFCVTLQTYARKKLSFFGDFMSRQIMQRSFMLLRILDILKLSNFFQIKFFLNSLYFNVFKLYLTGYSNCLRRIWKPTLVESVLYSYINGSGVLTAIKPQLHKFSVNF